MLWGCVGSQGAESSELVAFLIGQSLVNYYCSTYHYNLGGRRGLVELVD